MEEDKKFKEGAAKVKKSYENEESSGIRNILNAIKKLGPTNHESGEDEVEVPGTKVEYDPKFKDKLKKIKIMKD